MNINYNFGFQKLITLYALDSNLIKLNFFMFFKIFTEYVKAALEVFKGRMISKQKIDNRLRFNFTRQKYLYIFESK